MVLKEYHSWGPCRCLIDKLSRSFSQALLRNPQYGQIKLRQTCENCWKVLSLKPKGGGEGKPLLTFLLILAKLLYFFFLPLPFVIIRFMYILMILRVPFCSGDVGRGFLNVIVIFSLPIFICSLISELINIDRSSLVEGRVESIRNLTLQQARLFF